MGDVKLAKDVKQVNEKKIIEGNEDRGNEVDTAFYNVDLENMGNEEQDEYSPQLSNPDIPRYKKKYIQGRGIERYNEALKNLIPIRRKRKDTGTMPIESAGLFSYVSFSWLSKYMYKAYKNRITMEELPNVSPYDSCDYTTRRLELLWEEELSKRGPKKASFTRVVWRFCRTRVFTSWFVFTCSLVFGFISPTILMRNLLEYVQSHNRSYGEGLKWAFALILFELLRAIFFSWAWAINYTTALRLRSACLTLVYKKLIRCNNLGNKSIGEVINIFTNDAQRIFDMTTHGSMMIGGPITTVWGIFYVLWLLGPMALIGMAIFLLFYPLQYMVSYLTGYFRTKSVNISDLRVRLMGEILDCIKLIKMYAWEMRFNQDLLDLRKKEQQLLVKTSYCQGFSVSMAPTIPIISAVITFLAHLSTGSNLTAAQAFPLSTFFGNQIKQALIRLREGSQAIVDSIVAFGRVKSILLMEEGNCLMLKPILKSQAVTIKNGTFSCITFGNHKSESPKMNQEERKNKEKSTGNKSAKKNLTQPNINPEYVDILFDISFEAAKGKLVGICGPVGSGKSSLLLAALGQLRVSQGQVTRDGECAYVSQQAWITNATLRNNILFGKKFDESRYNKVIQACSLIQDIAMMPGGDQTEIGEKGINLSGGQKQRVALARALYADRDIYLLDDPLSAVDSRVGSDIFSNLILEALKEKTVLFVTHQIQYLHNCDDIYMMRDGRIVEHGTHNDLITLDNEYALMVAAISANNETEDETDEGQESPQQLVNNSSSRDVHQSCTISYGSINSIENVEKSNTPDTPFTVADNLEHGSIKKLTYYSYMKAAGGYIFTFIVILTFLVNVASTTFSSWWLALWIKAGGGNTKIVKNNETIISENLNDNPDFSYYQTIYGLTIGVILLTSFLRTLIFTKATIRASTKLHNDLFEKIINSPMRFFETTPSGRIQHLFSRDMDEVDNRLPISLTSFIQNVFIILSAILVICIVFPWFIVPLCVICTLYYFISKIFNVAIADLKRMENKSRAPVISHVTETIQGLSTIHAFEKEDEYKNKFIDMFDYNSKYVFLCCIAMRWLAVRIDSLSILITGITALFVILLQDYVPAALAGLALSYSAQISGILQYTIRLVSETEVRFISVERINHYLTNLSSEGNAQQYIIKPQSSWPVKAQITFNNVSLAYGDGPFILENLSFTINAGEKIGIVGRTGAGKSSLTVALFRLVELAEGKIEIDDVDISEISLEELRTKLSIIPQDPVLFSGTVRSNLDPFKLYTDSEIWKALEKTQLKTRVQSIVGQLDASVGFGGDNMSVGERQLLCLSRALLRNSKILVLDEATAAVDPETEKLVQNTIQLEFSHCTILTIAHRLQTVVSQNRVLVMDNGKVLEFDTPSNLLGNPNSEFSKMMAAAEQSTRQQP